MKKFALLLTLVLLVCGFAPISEVYSARSSYLILRTPARQEKHLTQHTYYPSRGYGVTVTPYAYGWFGARPKRHWTRSTGYYGSYLQWSSR